MKTIAMLAAAALFALPMGVRAQQNSSSSAAQSSSASSPKAGAQDPLAEAARKAREQRKTAPKAAKVFTNDNLPTAGGISTVGVVATPEKNGNAQTAAASSAAGSAAPSGKNQAAWRAKFAKLRDKLQRDQNELSIMQRELGEQQLQYYNGDPQKAAQDQASGQPMGAEYNKKRAAIDTKKAQVAADEQAISDAQDALRQAGGDPGWAR